VSMPELELELRELGSHIEYPRTPDIAGQVRRRLVAEPARGFPLRRALVLALAMLAVAAAAAMAVPQARTAILEFLGLRGAKIERVATQPTAPAPEEADLGLGERVTLARARERVDYDLLLPDGELGRPGGVYLSSLTPGGQVGFVYRTDDGDVRALLTQFQGSLERDFIQKIAGPETTVEPVSVDGNFGIWLEGEPHEFFYLDPAGQPVVETVRLAGNTLLWERGELTLRLEGDLTKEEALRIARSVR